jgi:hypothetical protein
MWYYVRRGCWVESGKSCLLRSAYLPRCLTATRRALSADDTLLAFRWEHLQGDYGGEGPGQAKLTTTVEHWRLVERNLGLEIRTLRGDRTDLGSALLPGPHKREYLVFVNHSLWRSTPSGAADRILANHSSRQGYRPHRRHWEGSLRWLK